MGSDVGLKSTLSSLEADGWENGFVMASSAGIACLRVYKTPGSSALTSLSLVHDGKL